MRIVQITPGSGGSFYCENCLRDAALVAAMRSLGHDVVMVPMYLPLEPEKNMVTASAPIFFGGLNVYLQQKSAFFRKTPRWLDRLLDSPGLLRWMGRKAGMTSAKDLGETTISMLRGRHGHQTKELDRLTAWLAEQENKPQVVCLSNILLAGLARPLKAKLGVPVVCLLQDEDGFLDGLAPPYSQKAWEIVGDCSRDMDAFIAVSRYYAAVMAERLRLEEGRLDVVYTGISLDGYQPPQTLPRTPAIGYLSRMCADRGLGTLVDAFVILKKNEKLGRLRLRVAGGERGDDEAFMKQIKHTLNSRGLINDVDFLSDFGRDARHSFLQTLSILSVPERQPVACGMYVLEALAAGVPVVEPAIGVFPELIEMTGGGVLYEPNAAAALAAALETLLLDPDRARDLGRKGRDVVLRKFNIEQTAQQMVRTYERLLK
jgi:glycosyltransferase involved in cell wall biosynthesis